MPRTRAFGRGVTELVLIVVGVLVALSLEAWWGNQTERRRQEAYFPQLRDELNNVVEEARSLISDHRRNLERLRRLSGATAPGAPAETRDSVVSWASALLYNQNFNAPMPVYTDFTSRIGIGEVGNDDLRRALIQYDLTLGDNQQWDDYFRSSMVVSWEPTLFARILLLTGLRESERVDLMPTAETLAEDLHFQNLVSARLLVETALVNRRSRLAEAATTVVERLDAEMRR